MSKYDTKDVKSVQTFLMGMKSKIDAINSVLPEDAEKFDFDAFTEDFYTANEGILKNRDTLKQEKMKASKELEDTQAQLNALNEKVSSIDETLPDKYNKSIQELETLKSTLKDGNVDLDVINKRHQDEIARVTSSFEKDLADKLAEKDNEVNSYKDSTEVFRDKYFATLKRDTLADELERINVNPEDRPLIMQAHLSRAKIADDGEGQFDVVFTDEKGVSLSGQEFWDKWASSDHNQKYLLADENLGGGASGRKRVTSVSQRDKLVKALNEATDLKTQITLSEELARMDKEANKS